MQRYKAEPLIRSVNQKKSLIMRIRDFDISIHYLDDKIAKAIAIAKNSVPKTVVALIKNDSKPLAFVLTTPSSPPPVNELAALLFDGCMTTRITSKIETTISAITSALYKVLASLKNLYN